MFPLPGGDDLGIDPRVLEGLLGLLGLLDCTDVLLDLLHILKINFIIFFMFIILGGKSKLSKTVENVQLTKFLINNKI